MPYSAPSRVDERSKWPDILQRALSYVRFCPSVGHYLHNISSFAMSDLGFNLTRRWKQGWLNPSSQPRPPQLCHCRFYQHLPEACEWDFGIVWGHAVSSDLVRWEHLPPALEPTPGWVDADGCFSGCCIIGPSGRPMILYTGVRLRSNQTAGPLPPPEHDLGMVWIESQCIAVPESDDDDLLIKWRKLESPCLKLPPAHLPLTGWRDPFVFTINTGVVDPRDGPNGFGSSHGVPEFRILMGSGIKGQGGTALVYRSTQLTDDWELEGQLCEGLSEDTGVVWECPILVPLLPVPQALRAPKQHEPPLWLVPPAPSGPSSRRVSTDSDKSAPAAEPRAQSRRWSHDAPSPPHAFFDPIGGPAPHHQPLTAFQNRSPPGQPAATAAAMLGKPLQAGALPTAGSQGAANEFAFGARRLQSQGSIEMWPQEDSIENDALREAASNGTVTAAEVERLVSNLERAATLAQWHDKSGSSASAPATALPTAPKGAVFAADRPPASEGEEATIGSRLGAADSLESGSANAGDSATAPFGSVQGGDGDGDSEDKFALAFSRVPALAISKGPKKRPSMSPPRAPEPASLSSFSPRNGDALGPEPAKQWHLFTVSPDAPTNPVLYWTGHVTEPGTNGAPCARFQMETAKGPFRLDLGDILYAPNVCQDGQGRWLLWGWLQERRKVGSYSYAGCLTMPRVLHVTDEGRLIQAPAPEVSGLREGRASHVEHVTLYPEAVVPIKGVSSERLDVECTIERGSAFAAGLLIRSYDAEADGSTAIVYDWDRNQLEAIFNVPPNWQPSAAVPMRPGVASPSDPFDDEGIFDPAAYLCTPKYNPLSRTPSMPVSSREATPADHPIDDDDITHTCFN